MKERSTGPAALLIAIFLINFLSLVYQVVWTRKIMVIFGTSALSISTILTVFLAGIALGGYLGGKLITSVKDKYRFCGLALVALGIYCLLSIYIFGLVKYPFMYFTGITESPLLINLVKFVFCAIILIFPTTIIGAMFPVVTHLYSVEFQRLGKDVASIYSLDTLGAAIGAALCGFFLVPVVGLALTSIISGALYIMMGAYLIFMEKGQAASPAAQKVFFKRDQLDSMHVLVLAVLFISGFSALLLEVVWSRYFHLIFGTSIYAFALVVAAFLAGLSAGSFFIRKYMDRIKKPVLVFGFIEILIAGLSLGIVQTSDILEALYMYLYHATNDFYLFQGILFFSAFLLLLVPTSLMGANFPLAIRIFARGDETKGKDAGLIFSVNTAGGIIGAFAAGFLIIPLIGLENTSILASLSYLAIGFVFILIAGRKPLYLGAACGLTAIFVVLGYFSYGEPQLDIAVYYNGIRKKTYEDYAKIKKNANIVFHKQGLYGLVAVEKDSLHNIALWTNGKVDASTSQKDMQNQEFLAHLPIFFHKKPEKALVIGFGGGVTVGSAVSHPALRQIDCIEIDPLVVEAAGKYFAPYNNNALADERVKVHYEDGRHYLDTTRETYDIIISEPSNIWISGVSQLFTREFYRIADAKLNPGGIFTQWLPAYDLVDRDFKLVINTLKERFEHVIYWTNNTDVIILASHEPFNVDTARIEALLSDPGVVENLGKAIPEPDLYSVAGLLDNMVNSEEFLSNYIIGFDLINSDNLNFLEFNTVRNNYNFGHRVKRH